MTTEEGQQQGGNFNRGPTPYQEWKAAEGVPIYTGS